MAVDEFIGVAPDIVLELGKIGKWIQAVGLIVILWVIVQVITMFYNRKRRKLLENINEKVEKIERKVDKLNREFGPSRK